jgi:flagellar basal body-associated protein FliL
MEGQMEQTNSNGSSHGNGTSLVIAIVVLVVAGIIAYFVYSKTSSNMMNETQDAMTDETSDPMTTSLEMQGTDDDLGSIEADLNATNFENIDQI